MAGFGASRPLPSAVINVCLLNRLPTLNLGGGHYSSCPHLHHPPDRHMSVSEGELPPFVATTPTTRLAICRTWQYCLWSTRTEVSLPYFPYRRRASYQQFCQPAHSSKRRYVVLYQTFDTQHTRAGRRISFRKQHPNRSHRVLW